MKGDRDIIREKKKLEAPSPKPGVAFLKNQFVLIVPHPEH